MTLAHGSAHWMGRYGGPSHSHGYEDPHYPTTTTYLEPVYANYPAPVTQMEPFGLGASLCRPAGAAPPPRGAPKRLGRALRVLDNSLAASTWAARTASAGIAAPVASPRCVRLLVGRDGAAQRVFATGFEKRLENYLAARGRRSGWAIGRPAARFACGCGTCVVVEVRRIGSGVAQDLK